MKKNGVFNALLIFAVLSAVSCKASIEIEPQEVEGSVKIVLSEDSRVQISNVTKADMETALPALDDFWVEIFKTQTGMRLYCKKYAEARGAAIKLNAGEYKLLAHHGDSLGCGFDKPYYAAEEPFTVHGVTSDQVSATARLSNVKMKVMYDETLDENFPSYYVRVVDSLVVKGKKTRKTLKFTSEETRCGFIPSSDNVYVEFYADQEGNNEWKYTKIGPLNCHPNDSVTVHMSSKPRYGSIIFDITVDGQETVVEQNLELPEYILSQPAPQILLAGFDGVDNGCRLIEGVPAGGAMVSILAKGAVKDCFVSVSSEDLPGVPESEVNILGDDAAAISALKTFGISWNDGMAGSRSLNFIDLSDIVEYFQHQCKSLDQEKENASFTIRVVDDADKESSASFKIVSLPVLSTLEIPDYKVWAGKVESPVLKDITPEADKSLFAIQTSLDGNNWVNPKSKAQTVGGNMVFDNLTVNPGCKYYVRVIYNNNPKVVSNTVEFVSESALQVGNNGFEDFQTATFNYTATLIGSSSKSRDWYFPWAKDASDIWWAVNSRKTMPSTTTPEYQDFKVFPSVSYSTNAQEGNKSAQLISTYVSSGATNNTDGGDGVWSVAFEEHKAAGEIWIGTATDGGDHASNGHAFASRPVSMDFYYRYAPIEGESAYAGVWLYDAAGNHIASGEKTISGVVNSWTACSIPLSYSTTTAKAAMIYVMFRSSSCADSEIHHAHNVTVEMAGKEYKGHLGSIFKIDNITLKY